MRKFITSFLVALLLPIISVAQGTTLRPESVKIYFDINSSVVDSKFMNNGEALARLFSLLESCIADNANEASRVIINASASPEGPNRFNISVANTRAKAIEDWIGKRFDTRFNCEINCTNVDWELLSELIEKANDAPYKAEIIEIIKQTPNQADQNVTYVDERQQNLEKLHNGEAYRWLLKNIYPELRYASVEVCVMRADDFVITSENPATYSAEGGNGVITFQKNEKVKGNISVYCEEMWIANIKEMDGNKLSFVLAPNDNFNERTATIKVACAGQEKECVITQKGVQPKIIINPTNTICVAAAGGRISKFYIANTSTAGEIEASSASEWISGVTAKNNTLTFAVATNKSHTPRSATITMGNGAFKTNVVVNQESQQSVQEIPQSVVETQSNGRAFYMSLSTNLLYDLLITPNVGAEIYLGSNFSAKANWHYAWWNIDAKNLYWRTYGGDLSVRWWFGKNSRIKPLTGHHVGVYGQIITYDFEFGKKGVLADRWSWSAGLDYGYSLPIAPRLNLDFTIGVGYHRGKSYEYQPIDGHYVWQATKRRQYIGPTKCEISLVWLLGKQNYNNR